MNTTASLTAIYRACAESAGTFVRDVGTPAPAPNAPAANPGFGPQAPNDTLSGGQPHSNSTYQKDRNGNQGLDLGWIGLLGLAGLFGIGRGRQTHSHEMSHDSGTTRG